jgi:hypothetical protein
MLEIGFRRNTAAILVIVGLRSQRPPFCSIQAVNRPAPADGDAGAAGGAYEIPVSAAIARRTAKILSGSGPTRRAACFKLPYRSKSAPPLST